MKGILDNTIGALNTSLNARQLEQNVTSSNIANADTPGYKAKRVEFEQELRRVLDVDDDLQPVGTHPGHIVPCETDPVNSEIYEDPNGIASLDGNTVNRADEMARLAENEVLYNASVEMLKRKLGQLKYAISDGGSGGGQ
jgi:flagellar basal-body rod protein FlgB